MSSWKTYWRAISYVIFGSICLGGWIWQTKEVSEIYFSYQTLTKIRFEFPERLAAPAVSICIKYQEIMDLKKYSKERKVDVRQRGFYHRANYNVSDLFEFTPNPNETVSFCQTRRRSNSYNVRYFRDGRKCAHNLFNITKYYYLDYICYKYVNTRLMKSRISYHNYAVSPQLSTVMYGFTFSHRLKAANSIKLFAHSATKLPYRSLLISTVVDRGIDRRTGIARQSKFAATFTIMTEDRLPPPYDTKCFNYSTVGHDSEIDCRQECIKNQTITQLGKIPFSTIQERPIEMKHLSHNDVRIENITRVVKKIEEFCHLKCSKCDCQIRAILTEKNIDEGDNSEQFKHFSLWMLVPTKPFVHVAFHPVMNFIEYLTLCLSTLSTWLGISFFHFNPLWMKKKYRMIRKSHTRDPGRVFNRTTFNKKIHKKALVSDVSYDLKVLAARLQKIEMVSDQLDGKLKQTTKPTFNVMYGTSYGATYDSYY